MDGLLNSKKAADLLGISERTLERLRTSGEGPKYVKLGKGAVRYDPTDLRSWIKRRKRASTSDCGPDETRGPRRRKARAASVEPQQTSAL